VSGNEIYEENTKIAWQIYETKKIFDQNLELKEFKKSKLRNETGTRQANRQRRAATLNYVIT